MTINVSRLVPGSQLTASTATYYTCPATTQAVVKRAIFCNTSGGAVTITAYVVPSGGTAGASNTVIDAVSVASGVTYVSPELASMTFGPGDTLQALSNTASAVTLVVSGITVV